METPPASSHLSATAPTFTPPTTPHVSIPAASHKMQPERRQKPKGEQQMGHNERPMREPTKKQGKKERTHNDQAGPSAADVAVSSALAFIPSVHAATAAAARTRNRRAGRSRPEPHMSCQESNMTMTVDLSSVEEVEDSSSPLCCICCEPMRALALGPCGHDQICATCILRLRLCPAFSDKRCPLCKQSNHEVILSRPEDLQHFLQNNNNQVSKEGQVIGGSTSAPLSSFQSLMALGSSTKTGPTRPTAATEGGGGGAEEVKGARSALRLIKRAPEHWARGVFVFDPSRLGKPFPSASSSSAREPSGITRPSVPLLTLLMRSTSRSCKICDAGGHHPFTSDSALQEHVGSVHKRRLCPTCLEAGTRFALEMEAMTEPELNAHMRATHPRCEFCKLSFYGLDEQFKHMNAAHYSCHVCQRLGFDHVYQLDAHHLRAHMERDHHLCEEPECSDCLVCFATQEELRQHYLQRHSRSMPRWDSSRARPLMMGDLMMSATTTRRAAGRGSGRGGRSGNSGSNNIREDRSGEPSSLFTPQPASVRGLGDMADAEGGLNIHDDDLGSGPAYPPLPPGSRNGVDRGGTRGGGGGTWGGQEGQRSINPSAPRWGQPPRPGLQRDEEFPSLASASQGTPSSGAPWHQQQQHQPQAAILRKVTARCPCGRRSTTLALREDEPPPEPLACDRSCEVLARKAQLAAAFNVEDPDHHVSYFDRHRTPVWTPDLLRVATLQPTWVKGLEQLLAQFIESTEKRTTLPAMNTQQRAVAHELSELGYGLSGVSTGSEPHRCITLYKNSSSGLPLKTLSETVSSMMREEVAMACSTQTQEQNALTLTFTDLSPGTDLNFFLREWAGDYSLSSPVTRDPTSVLVTFTKETTMKKCLNVLGGGIRGVFRITRQTPPSSRAPNPGDSSNPSKWLVISRPGKSRQQHQAATMSSSEEAALSSTDAASPSSSSQVSTRLPLPDLRSTMENSTVYSALEAQQC